MLIPGKNRMRGNYGSPDGNPPYGLLIITAQQKNSGRDFSLPDLRSNFYGAVVAGNGLPFTQAEKMMVPLLERMRM